ncbi:hypothetical protein [Leptobacterium sp. I13]|uniref:hypothetical protein n=1 Tax=Leptobacterium meishanense TaxID=3128904 RepID=UPI0030EBB505
MEKDTIKELFDQLQKNLDVESPKYGHRERFQEKLKNYPPKKRTQLNWWKPLSIAASIAVLISIGIGYFSSLQTNSLSPEVAKTQFYFASLLEQEMEKLDATATKDTRTIVADAMVQLKKIEGDYKTIEEELLKSGESKQLLYAMITNFQTRINLLKQVINQIEEVKQFKITQNEKNRI